MPLLSNLLNKQGVKVAPSFGTPTSGSLLFATSNVALGSSPANVISTNIIAPNKYPAHNLNFQIALNASTTSTSAVTTNPIEQVFTLTVADAKGDVLAQINGVNGEFTRWQHRLNTNGVYEASPTISIPASGNATATWNFSLQHLPIPTSEFPLTAKLTIAPLSQLGSGVSSATLQSFTMSADFSPTAALPVKLRTKLVPTGTGIEDFGSYVDRAQIYDLSMDVAADTNLNSTNSFYLAVNNNSLIPYASYESIITDEQNIYPIPTPHINGFFPFMVATKTSINGTQNVSLKANIATLPSIGGNSNVVNLYMMEGY